MQRPRARHGHGAKGRAEPVSPLLWSEDWARLAFQETSPESLGCHPESPSLEQDDHELIISLPAATSAIRGKKNLGLEEELLRARAQRRRAGTQTSVKSECGQLLTICKWRRHQVLWGLWRISLRGKARNTTLPVWNTPQTPALFRGLA